MRRRIPDLALCATLFVCWSIVGIHRAITDPSWICLVYGGLMTIHMLMTIDSARDLIKVVKTKKKLETHKSTEME